MSGGLTTANAAPVTIDGLSVTATPTEVVSGSGDSFTLQVTDTNVSGSTATTYLLYGVPSGWTVRDGSTTLSPTSPNPIIYTVLISHALAGSITITPPASYSGTLTVQLGRPMANPNLITDFDNGSFDYIGQSNPTLSSANTQYNYHDPTVLYRGDYYQGAYLCTVQYGPCDGDYSIWPTANMNGPQQHYNNYWADIRSLTNAMTTPSTATICTSWNAASPGRWASNTTQVTTAQSEAAGKIAVFNGSVDMPSPNNLLTTTVTGLQPNTPYVFTANVANLSDDPNDGTLPVRTAAYVQTTAAATGTIIGSTNPLPQQSTCSVGNSIWTVDSGIVYTDNSSQLILSMRNYGQGGFGNDLAIDSLALYPMALVPTDLIVTQSLPGLVINKTSDPANGSAVAAGQVVTYTLTAQNTGNIALNSVNITDDLSSVLPHAAFVTNSLTSTIGPPPSFNGSVVSWSGTLGTGQQIVITYQVRIASGITASDTLTNKVTGSGVINGSTPQTVQSNCITGSEAGCYSTLHGGQPGLDITKTSIPASGSYVTPGQTISYSVVVTNTGNLLLDPVSVTDDLSGVLSNATYVAGSASATAGTASLAGTTLSWSGQLAAGASATITYKVTVNAGAQRLQTLTNNVTGGATVPGGAGTVVPSNCTAGGTDPKCSSTVTVGTSSLNVSKVSDPPSGSVVAPGQTITYTVTATNGGDSDLNAVVTDDLSGVLANAMLTGTATSTVGSPPMISGNTLTWTGTLAKGASTTITYKVIVNTGASSATLRNKMTATATNPDNPGLAVPSTCTTGNETNCYSTLSVGNTGLTISKASSPVDGSRVAPGQRIDYTITATNTGTVPLSQAVVTDDLSDVLTHAAITGTPTASAGTVSVTGSTLTWQGPLDAGASATITYSVIVSTSANPSDIIRNRVTSHGTTSGSTQVQSNCVTGNESGCYSNLTVGTTGLKISKESTPVNGSKVTPGQLMSYTVNVTNTGTVTLTPAQVTDDLSGVLAHGTLSGIPSANIGTASISGTTLSWSGSLTAGQMASITYQVRLDNTVTTGVTLRNKVTGSATYPGNLGGPIQSNCINGTEPGCYSEVTIGTAGLTVTKVSSPPSGSVVTAGQRIDYTITATNTGDVTLNPVIVTDDLTNILSYANMLGNPTASTGPTPTVSGNTLTWSSQLTSGQSVTITYSVTVKTPATVQAKLVNKVTASGTNPDNPGGTVPSTCVTGTETSCESTLTVGTSGLDITKISDPPSGSFVTAGQIITYTVTATNVGDTQLNPVVITDDLTSVLQGAAIYGTPSASTGPPPSISGTGNQLTWTGTLSSNESVTITYRVQIANPLTSAALLTNKVTGHATNPTNPSETVPSTCATGTEAGCYSQLTTGASGLTVTKTSNPPSGTYVTAGTVVTYTIKATNSGTVPLNPVVVTDDLTNVLSHATIVPGSLTASTGPNPTVLGNTLTWSSQLNGGESVSITYQVKVNSNVVKGDTLRNRVKASGTNPSNPSAPIPSTCENGTEAGCSSDLPVGESNLKVTKTSSPVSGSVVTPGQAVTYTITATNTGDTTLNPVVVTDDLSGVLAHATMNGVPTASPGPAPVVSGGKLTWTGTLTSGQSVTITYVVNVNSNAVKGDGLKNDVTATGTNPDNPTEPIPTSCTTGNEPGCSSTVTVGNSNLSVTKTSDPASGNVVGPGQMITYTITATNTGDVLLSPVTVHDDLTNVLAHASYVAGSLSASSGTPTLVGSALTWTGAIGSGQSVTISYAVTVASSAQRGDLIQNDVTATGTDSGNPGGSVPSTCTTGNEPGCSSTVTVGAAGLTINKVSSPVSGSYVKAGQVVTYTVTATNTGDANLSPVNLSDDLSGVLSHATIVPGSLVASTGSAPVLTGTTLTWSGSLAKGASVTLTYQVTVAASVTSSDKLTNKVTGSATDSGNPSNTVPSNCVSGTETGCSSTLNVGSSSLNVTKASNPVTGSHVTRGQIITYTVTVSNNGTMPLDPVTATDDLSNVLANTTLVAGSLASDVGTAMVTGTTMSWSGPLAIGQTATITYQVKVNDNATIGAAMHNNVTAVGTNPSDPSTPVPSNCDGPTPTGTCSSTVTVGTSNLNVTKTSSPASGSFVTPGQQITYTITATNSGDTDLDPVVVTDNLTGVLAHASIVGMPTASSGTPSVSGNTLTWTGPLASGAHVTITYVVAVSSSVQKGDTIANDVTATGTNPDNPNEPIPSTCTTGAEPGCSSTVTVGEPKLDVTKVSDPPSGSFVTAGQVVTYTITATNSGDTKLDPVHVTDDLTNVLANAALITSSLSSSVGAAPTMNGNTLTWSGALNSGQVVTITYQVTINANAVNGQTMANKVKADGTDPDNPNVPIPSTCTTGTEADCSSDLTVGEPGLTVTKTSDPVSGTYVTAGQLITYTITAKNSGDVVLNPVHVTDDLTNVLSHATMVPGSLIASVGNPTLTGNTISWSGALAADHSVTITYQVKVNANVVKGDTLRNKVTADGSYPNNPSEPVPSTCESGSEPGCRSDLPVGTSGLTVTKVSSPVSGSLVTPGAPVTYTITATNTGDTTLNPVVVTDDLTGVLAHATLNGNPTASMGSAPSVTNNILTWTGTLASGQHVTITYTVIVSPSAAKGDSLANDVKATGTNPGNPSEPIPSTCSTGAEPGCSSTVTIGQSGLTVTKTSTPPTGSVVTAGQQLTYSITATNTGDVLLSPVTVHDDLTALLAHATYVAGSLQATTGTPTLVGNQVTWIGVLGSGQSVTITYDVTVAASVAKGDVLKNAVTASGTDSGNPSAPVPSTCTSGTESGCSSTVTVSEPGLGVTKTSDPPTGSYVTPGQVVTYTITATNTDDITLNPVNVTDDLTNVLTHATLVPGSLTSSTGAAPTMNGNIVTWSGSLTANQVVTITYKVTINANVVKGQTMANKVKATGHNPDNPNEPIPSTCDTGTEANCSSDLTVGEPNLTVTKTSNPVSGTHVSAGQVITYTIIAKNTGDVALDPVDVTDDLANVLSHATMVGSPTATRGSAPAVAAGILSWSGALAAGDSVTITYQVKVNASVVKGDVIANKVTASGTNPGNPSEPIPSTCEDGTESGCSSDLPVGTSGLTVTKTSSPASGSSVTPGTPVTYTITATNTGDTTLTPVVVTDDLSGVLAHSTLSGNPTASINPAPVVSGNTLTWTGTLTSGQHVTITYTVIVSPSAQKGDSLANDVKASGTNPDNPNEPIPSTCTTGTEPDCSSTITVGQSGLTITKMSTPVSGSHVTAGTTITYTILATNTGDVPLNPVTVHDDLTAVLAHANYVNASLQATTGTPTLVGNQITWTGALAANQSVTITYKVTVASTVSSGDVIKNAVTGSGTDSGNPSAPVPSTCTAGTESGCSSTVTVGQPNLNVTKASTPVSGSFVTGGQTVTYTITARNSGDVTLNPVHVFDDLTNVLSHATLVPGSLTSSAGATPTMNGNTVTWTGSLAASQVVTITYKVTINANVVKGQTLVNKVTADGTNPDNPDEPIPSTCETGTEASCESDLPVGEPGLTVTKVSDPASGSYVTPGQTVTYTITAKNTGDANLSPVIVSDNLANVLAHASLVAGSLTASSGPAPTISGNSLTWMGSLAPGQSVTITYKVTIAMNVQKGDSLANHVVAQGTNPDNPDEPIPSTCESGTEQDCSSDLPVGEPGLTVTKVSNPVSGSYVAPGQQVTYTITAKNTGDVALNPVTVTDDLTNVLTHATFVIGSLTSSKTPAATMSGNIVTWTGSLDPGQSVNISYKVTISPTAKNGDSLKNDVKASGTNPSNPDEPIPSTCTTGTEADCSSDLPVSEPGLAVTKTSNPPSGSYITGGQTVTYTIVATNTGQITLNPVNVTDDLTNVLSHAALVAGSLTSSQGATPTMLGNVLTWHGTLTAGQAVTITYKVKINANVTKGQTLTNKVTAEGTNPDNPDEPIPTTCETGTETNCESDLPVGEPGLTVTKASNPASGSYVTGGQTITYTITAKNTGDVKLNPVNVTDDLTNVLSHASLVLGSLTSSQGAAPTMVGNAVTWSGTLDPGQSVTITYKVKINTNVTKGQTLVNKVTADGTNPDNPDDPIPTTCETGTETGCESDLPVGEPGLTVTKVSDPPSGSYVTPGEVITYTITAKNTGDVTLSPVVVSDDMTNVLSHATLVAGSLNRSTGPVPLVSGNLLTWAGSLDPGQSVVITYQIKINMDVQKGDDLSNNVTATGTNPDNPDEPIPTTCETGTEDDCESDLPVGAPGLTVTKVSTPPSGTMVAAGTTITYTITAKNTGDVTLNPVDVTDDLTNVLAHASLVPGSLTASMTPAASISGNTLTWHGSLAAGATVTITYKVVVSADAQKGDTVSNHVTAAGTNPANPDEPIPSTCTTGSETQCSSTVTVGETGLTVTKVSNPPSGTYVTTGEVITYTITAKNTGEVNLNPVHVTDDLTNVLSHATLVSGSVTTSLGTPATITGNTLAWTGSLVAGQSVTISYKVKLNPDVVKGQTLANKVQADGTNPDNPDEPIPTTCETGTETNCESDLPVGTPGLTVTKVSNPPSGSYVTPGQTLTYTVTATNTGDVKLNPVVISDDMSAVFQHATLVPGSLHSSSGPDPVLTGNVLSWSGSLDPGQSVSVTYQITISLNAKKGDALTNNVTATGTDPDNPDNPIPSTCETGDESQCNSDLPIGTPGLTVTKVSDPKSGSYVTNGQKITYTITATNTGDVTLNPVNVTDDLTGVLAHAQLVPGSLTTSMGALPTITNNQLAWKGTLTAGQSVTISYQVTIAKDAKNGDTLANNVLAEGTNPDNPDEPIPSTCTTGTEADCSSNLPIGTAGLTVTKISDPKSGSTVTGGQVVTYTITAKNTGDVTLSPVTVTDNLSGVLAHATLLGTPKASMGDAPTVANSVLTWKGQLTAGQYVIITYQVKLNNNLKASDQLVNDVTAIGINPQNPDNPSESTCTTGDEPGCSSDLIPGGNNTAPTGGSVQGNSSMAAAAIVIIVALIGAAAVTLRSYRRRIAG